MLCNRQNKKLKKLFRISNIFAKVISEKFYPNNVTLPIIDKFEKPNSHSKSIIFSQIFTATST